MFYCNQSLQGSKGSLVFDQSDKSPDPGLQRTIHRVNVHVSGVLFLLLSQTEGKKDCLTAGYKAIGPLHELITSRDQLSVNTKTVHF